VSLCITAQASADSLTDRPDSSAIYGGELASTCQWPTTVSVDTGVSYCTGTLVHPEIVIYAAHCVAGPRAAGIYFGEWDQSQEPGHWVDVDSCKGHPSFTSPGPHSNDIAFCKLAQPVVGPPPTPPLMGCETDILVAGQEVTIVGFGQDETGNVAYKRWATTTLKTAPTAQSNTVQIGGGGVGACMGDSGGPAYVELDDGTWRAFGVVSGGAACGQDGTFNVMHPYVEWIETETGIDITPCHDADGKWNPSADCTGFATDPLETGLSWSNGCAGEVSGPGESCGPPHGGMTDEEAPDVEITAPDDGGTFSDAPAVLDVLVEADDGDGSGVKEVWLEIDGEEQASRDDSPPFSFEELSLPEGSIEIVALAEDHSGNVGVSSPVVVSVGDSDASPEGSDNDDGDTGDGEFTGSEDEEEFTPGADDDAGCGCRARKAVAPLWAVVLLGIVAARTRRR
jgi:hypothetical protein